MQCRWLPAVLLIKYGYLKRLSYTFHSRIQDSLFHSFPQNLTIHKLHVIMLVVLNLGNWGIKNDI